MKWGDLPAAAPANSSNPAAPPATSQTSTDVLVVRASRPHDPTAIYEVRARRPHHKRAASGFACSSAVTGRCRPYPKWIIVL